MNAEAPARIFVDTNILVYAHDRTAGEKHRRAKALLEQMWEAGDGCLSIQVLQEFYVTVTRKIRRPLDQALARQLVADLGHWRIHVPVVEDVLDAIALQETAGLSFWDAMIVQSAVRLGCRQLLSEDLNAGQMYGGVQVLNPFAPAPSA